MKHFAIILCVLLLNVKMFSQENAQNETGCNSLLKLYFLNGYGAIYQFDKTENSSFRLHVDFSTDGYDTHLEQPSYSLEPEPYEGNATYDVDGTAFTLQISPQYYFAIISKGYFNLYTGLGPMFSFGLSNNTSKTNTINSSSTHYSYNHDNSTMYDLGLICFAGVESKINDNLGVFSEIDLKGGRSWSNTVSKKENYTVLYPVTSNSSERTEKKWFYEFSSVRLGIYILL